MNKYIKVNRVIESSRYGIPLVYSYNLKVLNIKFSITKEIFHKLKPEVRLNEVLEDRNEHLKNLIDVRKEKEKIEEEYVEYIKKNQLDKVMVESQYKLIKELKEELYKKTGENIKLQNIINGVTK